MAVPSVMSRSKLSEVFSDLLVLGAHLRDARDLGSAEMLRTRLLRLFQEAEERGRTAGISQDILTQARYALTAFIDEMIINSRWQNKEQWASHPLQYEFFGEYVAGEGFFKRLDTIRSGMPLNTDLLEVFSLCIILGFEGQYKLHDRERLRGLMEDVTREIQVRRGEIPPLSPHGRRPDELLETVKRELPAWIIVVTSLSIVFFFYLGLSLLISHDATNVVDELKRVLREVGG